MNNQKDPIDMLDMLTAPAFRVCGQIVTQANAAAQALLITPGTEVSELLLTGQQEYGCFDGDCLYLALNLQGIRRGAAVRRMEQGDVFLLDPDQDVPELNALALAARELRKPLSGAMLSAEKLGALCGSEEAQQLNQQLHQILRLLGNMSDAPFFSITHKETGNICGFFEELFEKVIPLAAEAGICLSYQGIPDPIFCLFDRRQLERAALNLLSNAMKFTPAGMDIQARLSRRGRTLQLQIRDCGPGIADALMPTVFCRYLRSPGIEDPRQGLGLGMMLIRTAAVSHGGTVLIRREETGTAITMTMAITQSTDTRLRAQPLLADYAGERDHALVELSDSLPPTLYR